MRREDFETPEGGLFDDFDGTTINAYFGPAGGKYSQASGSAEPGLFIVFENPEAEKPIEQFFTIGKGWELGPDNTTVVNINKPELTAFGAQSKVGKIVNKVAEHLGGGDIDKGREIFAQKGIPMTNAKFYIGWNAHWKNEESKIKIDGAEKTVKTLLPTAWYGVVAEGAKPAAKATGTPASAPAAGKAPEVSSTDIAALDEIVTKASAGKTERELKTAILKDTPENKPIKSNREYQANVVNGTVLKRLEAEGKLFKDEKGIYTAI